ncbi:MAG: integrase arm-type DNA-binding domain-containing protein [Sphingomonas sp.]|uniref:tyrosine-type recombinase/integrase n=1 Tax=Sphingomonas sp. TaxID=28214 RepID=UPI001AD171BE|nr:site-specific integrase [Sphingomonas sp.]MBN8813890.1 integrase arm-type DNA-binding domain-containing protein [Sphingomonas sp.]
MGKLTVIAVRTVKEPGRYGDGDGLFLQVGSNGSKSWIVRVQKAGRRRDIGLGSASKVSLADARAKASKVRAEIEAGLDPVAERQKANGVPTFRQAAAQVFEQNRKTWKNGHHQWQWLRTLEMFAFPAIGDLPVSNITGPMVRDLLADIWLTKPETARRVRQRVGAVLDWAYSKGWRDAEAPVRSITKGLPRQPRKIAHHAALPYDEVPPFLTSLQAGRQTFGRLALEALILTAVRSGEVRGARWPELDLESKTWTIPAERMKAGKHHVVALSKEAVRVFETASSLRIRGTDLVFPGAKRDTPMSDMTLVKIMRDMKVVATPHGFRSSFRDWAADQTSFPGEVAEAALAHVVADKVVAAYRRTDFLEKRRQLMAAWGAFCGGPIRNVVRLAS